MAQSGTPSSLAPAPALPTPLPLAAPEPSGPLTGLWVTVFALANVYVAVFLAVAYFNAQPHALRRVRGWLARGGGSHSSGGREAQRAGRAAVEDARGGCAPGAAPGGAPQAELRVRPNGAAAAAGGAGAPAACAAADNAGGRGAAPPPPVTLEWRDVSLGVAGAKGRRWILQGVYGAAAPGELQALMGPSGAGKSSLMDVLAMRAAGGRALSLGGRVLVNSVPRRAAAFLAASAYVPQHDNFVPTMTAGETVAFYAAVLLPPSAARAARAARAAGVLQLMGLSARAATLVGGTLPGGLMLRGLSGGERRRLAIACSVVAGPSLVFLDEPTSGLDSFAALSVCRLLRAMAGSGHTLVASVHQPRAAIWRLFDKVTLLSQGRLMYHGSAPGLVPWFTEALGYCFESSLHGSPPDWALDLVSLGFSKIAAEPKAA